MNDEQTAQHTDGILRIDPDWPGDIQTADGSLEIAELNYDRACSYPAPPMEVAIANGRRLVACWNYCVGMATDDLETNAQFRDMQRRQLRVERDQRTARVAELEARLRQFDQLAERVDDLEQQRDQLLAGLRSSQEETLPGAAEAAVADAIEKLEAATLLQGQAG